jgi:hypothetical protein
VLRPDARLAVNLSARNLNDNAARDWVPRAVAAGGFPLDALDLEVTETGLLADAQAAGQVLSWLRGQGVGIALDDFGTGYSSLTYLRKLPVTTIKVDKEFIGHISDRSDDRAIVAAVIDLGKAVGLRTIAEGVETPDQLAFLNRHGCGAGQGYLWSRALSLPELAALLRGHPGFVAATPVGAGPTPRPREARATDRHAMHRIVELHQEGASLTTIAAALNTEGLQSPSGLRWHSSSVARVIADVVDDVRAGTVAAASTT